MGWSGRTFPVARSDLEPHDILEPQIMHSTRTFIVGMVAGGLVFASIALLAGAGPRGVRTAEFDAISTQRLDIVDHRGRLAMRLRGHPRDGAFMRVFDRHGNKRIEFNAAGEVTVFGRNERPRVRLGTDERVHGQRKPGVVSVFDPNGRLVADLGAPVHEPRHRDPYARPHSDRHPASCACDVCAAGRRHDDDRRDHDRRHGWRFHFPLRD